MEITQLHCDYNLKLISDCQPNGHENNVEAWRQHQIIWQLFLRQPIPSLGQSNSQTTWASRKLIRRSQTAWSSVRSAWLIRHICTDVSWTSRSVKLNQISQNDFHVLIIDEFSISMRSGKSPTGGEEKKMAPDCFCTAAYLKPLGRICQTAASSLSVL